jgi:hypothetical protein
VREQVVQRAVVICVALEAVGAGRLVAELAAVDLVPQREGRCAQRVGAGDDQPELLAELADEAVGRGAPPDAGRLERGPQAGIAADSEPGNALESSQRDRMPSLVNTSRSWATLSRPSAARANASMPLLVVASISSGSAQTVTNSMGKQA